MALCYPMAVAQGPEGDEEREQAEAQLAVWAPHKAHKFCGGQDPGGVQLHALRAQGVQGQAREQV